MGCAGLWLAAVIFIISSSTVSADGSFLQPVHEVFGVEFYEFNGERIGIYTEPVSWDEAKRICPSANGSLVEYLETEVGLAEFVGRALAESVVSFGALWIGGRYVNPYNRTDNSTYNTGVWKWVVTDMEINVEVENVTAFPMTEYPFWVSKPNLMSEEDLCLGTDRRLHHLPLIVPIDCKQKRPFICRIPANGVSGEAEVKPAITINSKQFRIFAGELTWVEALSRCKDLGMSLAKLTTVEEFMFIGNRMKRHRPIMDNAWIGGFFSENKWKWIIDDEDINVSNTTQKPGEPIAWYRPDEIIMEGCLLADRHVCDHFVYVEALCNRRRNFICERVKDSPSEGLKPIREYEDLYISTYRDTWFKAQNVCKVCLGGNLLQIHPTVDDVTRKLKLMYYAMAQTLGGEVRHLWLGGYLYGNTFKWSDAPEPEPPVDEAIHTAKFQGLDGKGENGVLQYCDADFKVDKEMKEYKCLNIDRENQKNFFMYGLKCDLKQSFICKATIRKEEIPCRLFNDPIIGPGMYRQP